MKILQASNGITKVQLYNIQKEASEKMKDAAGEPLKIAFWALGEREGQDGDDYQVLLINDVNDIVYSFHAPFIHPASQPSVHPSTTH